MFLELIWDIRRKPTILQTILKYGLVFLRKDKYLYLNWAQQYKPLVYVFNWH